LPLEAANKALHNISLANLFYQADAEDDIGLFAREAITRLLRPIPYTYIAGTEYKPYLLQGLSHFSPDVRKLSLNQVQKCLKSEEEIAMMVRMHMPLQLP
jgi:26S proteasome non-ATPase regulatory subunit 5